MTLSCHTSCASHVLVRKSWNRIAHCSVHQKMHWNKYTAKPYEVYPLCFINITAISVMKSSFDRTIMFLCHITGRTPAAVYSSSYSQCVQFFWLFFLLSCIKTLLSRVNSVSVGYNPSTTATAVQMETGSTFQKQQKLISLEYFYYFFLIFAA